MAHWNDVRTKTPEQIKDMFALKNKPDRMVKINVPGNSKMENGPAAGEEDGNPFGKGGGNQYRALERLPNEAFMEETATPLTPNESVQITQESFFKMDPTSTIEEPVAPATEQVIIENTSTPVVEEPVIETPTIIPPP